MKALKKIICGLTGGLLVLSFTSCDASRNTKTPTGSLKLDSTYASIATNESVSYGEMYNLLRNKGYSSVVTEIRKQLFQKEMAKISYTEFKEDYDDYIMNAIYSVNTAEDFEDIDEKDVLKKVNKFIDNQLTSTGIDYRTAYEANPEQFIPTVVDGELVCTWNEKLIDQYTYVIAIIEYAKDYIDTYKYEKKVYNVDGALETNSYYIDDDVRKTQYTSIQNYTTTADLLGIKYNDEDTYKNHAIVVKFASAKQAEKYVEATKAETGIDISTTTSDAEALTFYMSLYNAYYKDKESITDSNYLTCENSAFTIDKDENQFTSHVGTTAVTFMTENLVDVDSEEDGQSYLTKPWNISGDDYYYMCYRINIYEGEDFKKLEFDSTAAKQAFYNKLDEIKVEEWATETYANKLVERRMKEENLNLEIFDAVYENQFMNSYEDYYDYTKHFNNDLVFVFSYKYPSDAIEFAGQTITGSYKVDDSFNYLNSIYGTEAATKLLASKYLLNCGVLTDELADNATKGYTDGVKETIKKFKKNQATYSRKMGLSNYLVLSYGYDNISDIVNYKYLGADLVNLFNTYYGAFNGEEIESLAASYQLGSSLTSFKDTGLFAIFKKYADKAYDQFYSLDICHMLISIDTDLDGTLEDPEEYLESLSEENKTLFINDILTLADAVALEANIITTDSKIDALTFIAKVFNNAGYNYVLQNEKYAGKTWADFKKNFEFALKAEDLSTISISNGSNYVEEFSNEVKSLYDDLMKKITDGYDFDDLQDDVEDKGYSKYISGVDTTVNSLEQLTQTTYGWHMLYVYNITENSTCKFNRDSDSNLSTNVTDADGNVIYVDSEGNVVSKDTTGATKLTSIGTWQYQDIIVYAHDTDTTDDDEVIYASGYSDDKYASLEQLFIYFMEYNNNGSVSSLKSSVSSAVSQVFNSVMTRYTSSNMQTLRLYAQIGEITFAEAGYSVRYDHMVESLQRNIDSYEVLEEDDLFYGWFNESFVVANLHK